MWDCRICLRCMCLGCLRCTHEPAVLRWRLLSCLNGQTKHKTGFTCCSDVIIYIPNITLSTVRQQCCGSSSKTAQKTYICIQQRRKYRNRRYKIPSAMIWLFNHRHLSHTYIHSYMRMFVCSMFWHILYVCRGVDIANTLYLTTIATLTSSRL